MCRLKMRWKESYALTVQRGIQKEVRRREGRKMRGGKEKDRRRGEEKRGAEQEGRRRDRLKKRGGEERDGTRGEKKRQTEEEGGRKEGQGKRGEETDRRRWKDSEKNCLFGWLLNVLVNY